MKTYQIDGLLMQKSGEKSLEIILKTFLKQYCFTIFQNIHWKGTEKERFLPFPFLSLLSVLVLFRSFILKSDSVPFPFLSLRNAFLQCLAL